MKRRLLPPPVSKRATKPRARPQKNSDLVTIDEATALLHCHRVTLLRLIQREQLHLLKVGGRWMFEHAELDALNNRNISIYPHLTVARHRPGKPRH